MKSPSHSLSSPVTRSPIDPVVSIDFKFDLLCVACGNVFGMSPCTLYVLDKKLYTQIVSYLLTLFSPKMTGFPFSLTVSPSKQIYRP